MPSINVKFGKNVKVPQWRLVNLYNCQIGDNTKIGAFVEIQKKVTVGKNCKIQSHTFICEGVVIEDNVFVGHNVSFINDKYPKATNGIKLLTEEEWAVSPIIVKKGASIGTGSTIMCGIIIGENAQIGAGSVVLEDIPQEETWAGNPARRIKNEH